MAKVHPRNAVAVVLASSVIAFAPIASAQGQDESVISNVSSALDGWSGSAIIGATTSSGNSDTSNINGSIRLTKTVNKWENLIFGTIFKGSSAIVVDVVDPNTNETVVDESGNPQRTIVRGDNSDRLALGYQPKYFLNEKTYGFGILDWEQDEPSNIDSAFRQVIGVGHRFYSDDSGFLSVEIGFGNKNTSLVSGDDIDGGIGYLGLNFLNNVTENVTFNADMRSDFGSDNTFVELGLGVSFKLSEKLALKISHFTRSNSDLTSSDDLLNSSSDSVSSLNLVIDI